jgi:hypothetical protein
MCIRDTLWGVLEAGPAVAWEVGETRGGDFSILLDKLHGWLLLLQ